MSTATYDSVPAEAPVRRVADRRRFFARALDALIQAQMRRAQQEVARHQRIMPKIED